MRFYLPIVLFLTSILLSCNSSKQSQSATPIAPTKTEVVILHLNDVYEIGPVENGSLGGMARVATLTETLERENAHVISVLSGDFLNPSVIGSVKINKKKIAGEQMVDLMNRVGVDYVTFGNHEFDLDQEDLVKRIDESDFEWISSNTFHKTEKWIVPFEKDHDNQQTYIQPYKIHFIPRPNAKPLRIGIIGVCLPFNQQSYVAYHDVYEAARITYDYIKDKTDFVVAITHLLIEEDRILAEKVPGVPLIMGGHEHENNFERIGPVAIAKADANAKSAYIHTLVYDHETEKLTINSRLQALDSTIVLDAETQQVVEAWEAKAYEGFKSLGFSLNKKVAFLKTELDGREVNLRTRQTNMGEAVAHAIFNAKPGLDLGIVNSGSIRFDDVLEGQVTEFDIVRAMPYGGPVVIATMKGSLLGQVLDTGLGINKGSGGYLQLYNVEVDGRAFKINGKPLDASATYKVGLPDFVMKGLENNLGFLNPDNPDVLNIERPTGNTDPRRDVRFLLIDYLKNL